MIASVVYWMFRRLVELLVLRRRFGMEGAMFLAPEPSPIFTATLERGLAMFGPRSLSACRNTQSSVAMAGPGPKTRPRRSRSWLSSSTYSREVSPDLWPCMPRHGQ